MGKKELKSSALDNILGYFSPKTKLDRMRNKVATDYLKRKYEGASSGRRTAGWSTGSTSSNTEIAGSISRLRNRSRDLVRNNPYAARGIQGISNNVVGKGIMTQFNASTKRRETQIMNTWNAWANTTACDYDGRHNLMGLQRIVMRTVAEGGDVLVRRRNVGKQTAIGPDGKEIQVPSIQLQILEGDYLDGSTLVERNLQNGNRIEQGIEFSKEGKRVAYKIFESHPGGSDTIASKFKSNRIDAKQMLHIFRADRAGQFRGVPWLAPVMLRLRDFDEFEDAELVRQKIASMFTAFVSDIDGVDDVLTDDSQIELGEKMEPGLIELLPPGKDVKLANPPNKEGYKDYTNVMLHSIATGLGVTYEMLTGDLGGVNFSSGRMGHLEFQRNVDTWRNQIMINQFMKPVSQWFLNNTEILGIRKEGVETTFTAPRREMIDPTKEVPAQVNAIKGGLLTLSEAIRQSGRDPETHMAEYKRDVDAIEKLGLTLDSIIGKSEDT